MKILWVEDDYVRLSGLMRPLEKKGFVVDHVLDYPSFDKLPDIESYDLYVIDLILPQKDHGKTVSDEEFVSLPGMQIIDRISDLGKPIIVFTVVIQAKVHKELEKKKNVKKILIKGNIFPSDFMEDVYDCLGMEFPSNNG